MNNKTRVTIPNEAETEQKPYFPTDYAVATGALCSRNVKEYGGIRGKDGFHWLRVANSDKSVRNRRVDGGVGRYDAGCRKYAALARFQNPEQSGLSTSVVSGKRVLTKNGKPVLYPQRKADYTISQQLTRLRNTGNLSFVGHYESDATDVGYDSNKNKSFRLQTNVTYDMGGQTYCHVAKVKVADVCSQFRDGTKCSEDEGYWFECGPVEVERYRKVGKNEWRKLEMDEPEQMSDEYQTAELLFATKFEPQDKYEERGFRGGEELDTDEFQIGMFVNDIFLRDLERSVEFNYAHKFEVGNTTEKVAQLRDDNLSGARVAEAVAPVKKRVVRCFPGTNIPDLSYFKKDGQDENFIEF